MNKAWFEMKDTIRRKYADAVWIPLEASEQTRSGQSGHLGYKEEFVGVRTLAVYQSQRAEGAKLSWGSIFHDHEPYAHADGYKPAEVYEARDDVAVGVALVLKQNWSGIEIAEWHLNQDLILALDLKREGDVWVCPKEGFIEAVKLRRDDAGDPVSIVIRADFLKDYLAARFMSLRVMSFWERQEILLDPSDTGWGNQPTHEVLYDGRFEGRAMAIHEGGSPFGSTTAVFHMSRTDVDTEADVPVMGPENNDNVHTETSSFGDRGRKLYRIQGEFWRDEWVEPAALSPRVRRDDIPSSVSFFADASGLKILADKLNNEDIGQWLWFSSGIINTILTYRGSSLSWYTRETGSIEFGAGYSVHFGLNEKDLINVYAYDIARLPEWQRAVWAGFNVIPDGGVSNELMQSQVVAAPAHTQAPEAFLQKGLSVLNDVFSEKWGKPLLRPHDITDDLHRKIHRFRAQDESGLLALAKDIARLTADSIDVGILHTIVPLKGNEKRGSLKSLQVVIETIVGVELAKDIVGTLVGIYDLRLADAHLPPKELDEAKALVGIDPQSTYIQQGFQMLRMAVSAIYAIAEAIVDGDKRLRLRKRS